MCPNNIEPSIEPFEVEEGIATKIEVLLVDDAEDFVNYMKKRLTFRGIAVSVAYSGEEALEIIKKQPFNVVVLDVIMPDMDGIETLQEIKKIKPNVPVIMLTADGTAKTATDAMKAGAADYILKPCDVSTLLDSIKEAYVQRSPFPMDLKAF